MGRAAGAFVTTLIRGVVVFIFWGDASSFVLLGFQDVFVHDVFVSAQQVEEVTTLPGTNERSEDVADRVLIGPLAPLAAVVILVGEVLPDDARKCGRWIQVTARNLPERLVYADERNRNWDS